MKEGKYESGKNCHCMDEFSEKKCSRTNMELVEEWGFEESNCMICISREQLLRTNLILAKNKG